MSDSPAFEFATEVHEALFNDEENQRIDVISPGEIRADLTPLSRTERLYAYGEIDGEPASQTFSRSTRIRLFYLTTTFHRPGGAVLRTRIGPEAPDTDIAVIEASLFMGAYKKMISEQEA